MLEALIAKHSLTEHLGAIRSLVRPCVTITTSRVTQADLGPHDSRFGGLPHLPATIAWPEWRGTPQDHIATIRLSEASRHDSTGMLPKTGMLWFFVAGGDTPWGFDPGEAGFMRVLYEPNENAPLTLRPPAAPSLLSRLLGRRDKKGPQPFAPCGVDFAPGLTLPDSEWISEHVKEHADLASIEAYDELVYDIENQLGTPHRLLGHANLVQNPWETECQLVSRGVNAGRADMRDPNVMTQARGAGEWRQLLQIGSDDAPGWMWGDAGTIYFAITRQALAAREFDKAWMILQCF